MHVCTETRTADIRRNVRHTADELLALVNYIKGTSEVPTILMEPTSHYHYPLLKAFQEANLPVCLINPYQMKKYGDTALRKAKTDKRDSIRIAQYALEKSYSLIPYTPSDQKYEDLDFCPDSTAKGFQYSRSIRSSY